MCIPTHHLILKWFHNFKTGPQFEASQINRQLGKHVEQDNEIAHILHQPSYTHSTKYVIYIDCIQTHARLFKYYVLFWNYNYQILPCSGPVRRTTDVLLLLYFFGNIWSFNLEGRSSVIQYFQVFHLISPRKGRLSFVTTKFFLNSVVVVH